MICGNKIGGSRDSKTYIITDENNTIQLTGVVVDELQVFDACCDDVVSGKTFACDAGVMTGTNDSPCCRVSSGYHEVAPGVEYLLNLPLHDQWDYTTFSCIITSKANPHSATKTVIDDAVYDLNGTKLADVTKDSANKTIRLNITNDTAEPYLLHFFICKEE